MQMMLTQQCVSKRELVISDCFSRAHSFNDSNAFLTEDEMRN
jgi:hypothetical protein